MNKQTESFYNKLSFFYPLVDVFLRRHKRVLFQEINKLPDGDLLDIGVGNGSNLRFYTVHRVVGIDSSERMLQTARKEANKQVALHLMNAEELRFEEQCFDYVVLSHVLAVVDDPEKVLKEVYRVLKPKGRVIVLNHFTPDNWLAYIDRSFSFISGLFHFRSVFYRKDLAALRNFSEVSEVSLGWLSYFKLSILEKS